MFVPIWLVLRRCEATNLGVFALGHFALISPYSNGAVQIRVTHIQVIRGLGYG